MQKILFTVIALLMAPIAFSQNKAGKNREVIDTVTIYHDVFKGKLPYNGNINTVTLQLGHKLYYDYGDFTLDEIYSNASGGKRPVKTTGNWTVLRGDAIDENATVVEIDAPYKVLYFLRLKNGNLQQLDTTLHEIKPVKSYLLRKVKKGK